MKFSPKIWLQNTQSLTHEQRKKIDQKIIRYFIASKQRQNKLLIDPLRLSFDEAKISRYYKNRDYKDFLLDARWELWNG